MKHCPQAFLALLIHNVASSPENTKSKSQIFELIPNHVTVFYMSRFRINVDNDFIYLFIYAKFFVEMLIIFCVHVLHHHAIHALHTYILSGKYIMIESSGAWANANIICESVCINT